MRKSALVSITLGALFFASLPGCGTNAGKTAPLLPVKGKVTFKGQPLTKGIIRFRPVGAGRTATGQIQSDGTFTLTTFKEGDGAAIGTHQVSVSGTGVPGKTSNRKSTEIVPAKYTQPITSGLTADVDAEHTEFSFDLKDGR